MNMTTEDTESTEKQKREDDRLQAKEKYCRQLQEKQEWLRNQKKYSDFAWRYSGYPFPAEYLAGFYTGCDIVGHSAIDWCFENIAQKISTINPKEFRPCWFYESQTATFREATEEEIAWGQASYKGSDAEPDDRLRSLGLCKALESRSMSTWGRADKILEFYHNMETKDREGIEWSDLIAEMLDPLRLPADWERIGFYAARHLCEQATELREKFKDEPQKMNEEVMKLYTAYGVNPAA